ncbi:MAG: formate/nitrite transporter family protein [Bacteroidales bacterium]|nr:formate/nitrite transporter family protein [Bacteroidales bacterium]MBQ7273203.1 formate/nitrite transporter family protein [Bacteroidales bacterium]
MNNRKSFFAGILIGLGACGYLALGGLPGAIIFAFGLIGVVLSGSLLYTGRAGVMKLSETGSLAMIWLFNILACILLGLLMASLGGEPVERAQTAVAGRLAQGPWRSFLRAVGCGLIIDIAVWMYRTTKNILPVLFGVPLFIVCGFYHSIADVVYLVAAWKWSPDILWYYPVIVLGNYAGCNVRRLILPKEQ